MMMMMSDPFTYFWQVKGMVGKRVVGKRGYTHHHHHHHHRHHHHRRRRHDHYHHIVRMSSIEVIYLGQGRYHQAATISILLYDNAAFQSDKKTQKKHQYIIIRQYSFLADHHISTFCSNHQIFIHLKMRKRECVAGCPFQGIHFAIQTNKFCNTADKYILQSRQIHFAIQTNTFCNLAKYILQSRQIHFSIQTNTFCYQDKYVLQSRQTHFSIQKNTFCYHDKYILQSRQILLKMRKIHFAIKTNTFCDGDKYF